MDVEGSTYQVVPHRGISGPTFKKYQVFTKVGPDNKPLEVSFPYHGGGAIVRSFEGKQFRTVGNAKDTTLFGKDLFPPGCNDTITITEGAYDALAAYEMLGAGRPVVSVFSATRARKDCEREYDYLNSFKTIVLALDNDEVGQRAAKSVASLFDSNKVRQVEFGVFKDANEFLEKRETKKFCTAWANAKPFLPKDVLATYADVEKALSSEDQAQVGTYPFSTLNEMAYGIRLGEVVLFTAQEKVGKTEVIRAIEHHLLRTTDENMGIIHLEESEKRSIQGLAGLSLGCAAHLPDTGVSNEDVLKAYMELTRKDGRCHFYTHFGADNPDSILDTIRYLVAVRGCKFIFLDHITMLVTGEESDDERRKLDRLSTKLTMLTRELGFTLFLVSHVNDEGKTRGSRNIAKVADLLIHLERDIESPDLQSRSSTRMFVRGNRYAGVSGPAGTLKFDGKAFRIYEPTLEELKLLQEADPGF